MLHLKSRALEDGQRRTTGGGVVEEAVSLCVSVQERERHRRVEL